MRYNPPMSEIINLSPRRKVAILGAGNVETAAILRDVEAYEAQFAWSRTPEFVGYIDPIATGMHLGLPILGGDDQIKKLVENGFAFANIISNSTVARCRAARAVMAAGGQLVDLIHPSCRLDPDFEHGVGTYMQQDCRVQSHVKFGDNCSVHGSCWISHGTILGDSVQLTFRCNIAGDVFIDDGAYIGAGATILPGIYIGKWATVGAGAVVIRNVQPGETVVGNPAKVIKALNELPFPSGAIRTWGPGEPGS